MKESLLSVQNLDVSYTTVTHKNKVLSNFNLSMEKGEIVALVGESGSGKSTAAMALLDLLPESAIVDGSIVFQGCVLPAGNHAALMRVRGNGFGLIIQEPMASFNPLMRIGDQIAEAVTLRSDSRKISISGKIHELLQEAGIDEAERAAKAFPHQLSGGQLQRSMIAMALARDPAVLIADEPTTALDPTVQKKIVELLNRLRIHRGMAILMISHDLNLVASAADRIIILKDGISVEAGSTQSVLRSPVQSYTRELIQAHPGAHAPGSYICIGKKNDTTPQYPPERHIGKQEVIRMNGVSAEYRTGVFSRPFKALHDINLVVHQGETVGIVGESGSGKSTLGKLLIRALPQSSGTIEILGQRWSAADNAYSFKGKSACQMVFQNSYGALNHNLKVRELLKEPHELIMKTPRSKLNNALIKNLEEVGLGPEFLDRKPYQLSGGQRQRVNIARALAGDPAILVCDEAVSALDSTVQAAIINLLITIRSERNLSLVFIAHDMDVIRHVSDRIIVMDKGRIVEQADSWKIFHDPQTEITKKLMQATFSANCINVP